MCSTPKAPWFLQTIKRLRNNISFIFHLFMYPIQKASGKSNISKRHIKIPYPIRWVNIRLIIQYENDVKHFYYIWFYVLHKNTRIYLCTHTVFASMSSCSFYEFFFLLLLQFLSILTLLSCWVTARHRGRRMLLNVFT